jgi:hypothetical protein
MLQLYHDLIYHSLLVLCVDTSASGMRITENLQNTSCDILEGQQTCVLLSMGTLGKGFCLDMQMQTGVEIWIPGDLQPAMSSRRLEVLLLGSQEDRQQSPYQQLRQNTCPQQIVLDKQSGCNYGYKVPVLQTIPITKYLF